MNKLLVITVENETGILLDSFVDNILNLRDAICERENINRKHKSTDQHKNTITSILFPETGIIILGNYAGTAVVCVLYADKLSCQRSFYLDLSYNRCIQIYNEWNEHGQKDITFCHLDKIPNY